MKCDNCGEEAQWHSIQHRYKPSDNTDLNKASKPVLEQVEENLCSECVRRTYLFEIEESASPYRCDFCQKPLGKKVFRVKLADGTYKTTLVVKTKSERDYLFCSPDCVYQFHQCKKLKHLS